MLETNLRKESSLGYEESEILGSIESKLRYTRYGSVAGNSRNRIEEEFKG